MLDSNKAESWILITLIVYCIVQLIEKVEYKSARYDAVTESTVAVIS